MKLGKKAPRGMPFAKGNAWRGNASGKPHIKWRQKLSVIAAETLSEIAEPEDCRLVNLPEGSTKGKVVIECAYRLVLGGDISAAKFLLDATESARVRVEQENITVNVFTQARDNLLRAMTSELPETIEVEP